MAVKPYRVLGPAAGQDIPTGVIIVLWTNLADGDTGKPFPSAHFGDKWLCALGSFGGGTIAMEGTPLPDVLPADNRYVFIFDTSNNPVAITAAAPRCQLMDNPFQMRPTVLGGAAVNVDLYMVIVTSARR